MSSALKSLPLISEDEAPRPAVPNQPFLSNPVIPIAEPSITYLRHYGKREFARTLHALSSVGPSDYNVLGELVEEV